MVWNNELGHFKVFLNTFGFKLQKFCPYSIEGKKGQLKFSHGAWIRELGNSKGKRILGQKQGSWQLSLPQGLLKLVLSYYLYTSVNRKSWEYITGSWATWLSSFWSVWLKKSLTALLDSYTNDHTSTKVRISHHFRFCHFFILQGC